MQGIHEPLITTIPVLTVAFHMLCPESIGSDRLRDFVLKGGLGISFFTDAAVDRAFELMDCYADHPMDLADASLVTAAENLKTPRIFAIDRRYFSPSLVIWKKLIPGQNATAFSGMTILARILHQDPDFWVRAGRSDWTIVRKA